MRGRLATTAGDWAEAEADYQRAAERGSPELLTAWYDHQAAECRRRGQWDAALWYAERRVAARPGDWQPYADRAAALAGLGRAEEREADLARALEREPDRGLLAALADERAAGGKWAEAAALLRQAGEGGAFAPEVWRRYGLACLKAGDRNGYRRACDCLLREVTAPGPDLGPARVRDAVETWTAGPGAFDDWGPALAALDRALERLAERETSAPADLQVRPRRARRALLLDRGAARYRAGDGKQAVEILKGRENEEGDEFRAAVFLTLAWHGQGERARAEQGRTPVSAWRPREGPEHLWENVEADLLRQEVEYALRPDPGK
jgi:tetratricopeptide (TPR) repeat protein